MNFELKQFYCCTQTAWQTKDNPFREYINLRLSELYRRSDCDYIHEFRSYFAGDQEIHELFANETVNIEKIVEFAEFDWDGFPLKETENEETKERARKMYQIVKTFYREALI